MDIRLIVMDMDGTLLNPDQEVSPRNAEALRKAAAQGVHLAICSGRSPGDIALFALENGLQDCALLSLNGLYCQRRAFEEPFAQHLLDEETLRDVIAIIRDERQPYACYAQNSICIFPQDGEDAKTFFTVHDADPRGPQVLYGEEGYAKLTQGVNKLINFAPNQESWERTRRRLMALPRLEVSTSWPLDFELWQKGFGKGSAVSELAAQLGLTADQVMAIGDYDNDESMIRWAGMGVAMENATECIKQAAQFITLSNAEDGVAYAIEKFVLK